MRADAPQPARTAIKTRMLSRDCGAPPASLAPLRWQRHRRRARGAYAYRGPRVPGKDKLSFQACATKLSKINPKSTRSIGKTAIAGAGSPSLRRATVALRQQFNTITSCALTPTLRRNINRHMILGWTYQLPSARVVIAAVVVCLIVLQSFALATSPAFAGGARDPASHAAAISAVSGHCDALRGDKAPAQGRCDHSSMLQFLSGRRS